MLLLLKKKWVFMIKNTEGSLSDMPNLSLVNTYIPLLWLIVRGTVEVTLVWVLSYAGVSAPALIIGASALVAVDVQVHAGSLVNHACAFTALPVLSAVIHGAPLQPLAPLTCMSTASNSSDAIWAVISVITAYISKQDQATSIALVLIATAGTSAHLTLSCFDLSIAMSLIRTVLFYLCCGIVHFTRAARHVPLRPVMTPYSQKGMVWHQPCGCSCLHTLAIRDGPMMAAPVLICHDVVAVATATALCVVHLILLHRDTKKTSTAAQVMEAGEYASNTVINKDTDPVVRCSSNIRSRSRERLNTLDRRTTYAQSDVQEKDEGKPNSIDNEDWAKFCAAKAAANIP